MNKDSCKKPILYILLTAACTGLVFAYSRFSPEGSSWFPKCIFLQLTGLKCPGCGSQRVVHNLLNLNIRQAFEANAFLVLALPYIISLLVSVPLRSRFPTILQHPKQRPRHHHHRHPRHSLVDHPQHLRLVIINS